MRKRPWTASIGSVREPADAPLRPRLRLLGDSLAGRIVDEARDVLGALGVDVREREALDLLADHGARVDRATRRARLGPDLLDRVLAAAPREVSLFDVAGQPTHALGAGRTHFAPGSAAIRVLDGDSKRLRPPSTADYVRYTKLVQGLPELDAQATALVPADVPPAISDAYRLFLSLLHGTKPVVTGAFSADGLRPMIELQLAVRGSDAALAARPLCVFTCCPTSPLQWSRAACRNLLDCARAGIPVEIISVPLAGFLSPVSLVGTLVQHTAENWSGLALAQLAAPGAPVLWGCAAAVFDVRYETAPTGAMESTMLACAASEIGHRLALPTQAYVALSDAKQLDAQAGAETAAGAVLAVLAGIDAVSGPGMLAIENALSLEKLVLDDALVAQARRLLRGIAPCEDLPTRGLLEELMREGHLLVADHTRRHLKTEIVLPGPVLDRASEGRWREDGARPLTARAAAEVERIVAAWPGPAVPPETARELERLMAAAAARAGCALPDRPR
jgi:trimethylamine--corrinoid protein Co-methyltransferase